MARILFIGEAVALAHVSRPLVLAEAAHAAGHDVTLAAAARSHWLLREQPFAVETIDSIAPERFLGAIARGAPLFDAATLSRYVRDDLALIARARPDVVVGDLRLSLSASARIAKVPFVALCNAYWSPYARDARYPVPPLRALRALPLGVANAVFRAVRPAGFAWHARPLNRVRREHGLAALPYDVRYAYTDADRVAYVDIPELFPLDDAPPTHRFIGPIVWSPPAALPVWWDGATSVEGIYLTLGSSGDPAQLPMIVAALAAVASRVIVSTAGQSVPATLPDNVFAADYLPGDIAARRAALVVCNGGAPTSQQALAAGVPVLGIASNMDQLLNMQALERAGAGIALRGERADAQAVAAAARRMMGEPAFGAAARRVAEWSARCRATQRFVALLADALG